MIASAVLAIALLALLGVMFSAQVLNSHSRENETAAHELQSAVEDTFSVPYAGLKSQFPDGSLLAAYTNKALRDERVRILYVDNQSDALTYRVELQFTNFKGHPQAMAVSTRRSR